MSQANPVPPITGVAAGVPFLALPPDTDASDRRPKEVPLMALIVVPDMAHALADEPGILPAPQTPHATFVDQHTTAWFRVHLPRCA